MLARTPKLCQTSSGPRANQIFQIGTNIRHEHQNANKNARPHERTWHFARICSMSAQHPLRKSCRLCWVGAKCKLECTSTGLIRFLAAKIHLPNIPLLIQHCPHLWLHKRQRIKSFQKYGRETYLWKKGKDYETMVKLLRTKKKILCFWAYVSGQVTQVQRLTKRRAKASAFLFWNWEMAVTLPIAALPPRIRGFGNVRCASYFSRQPPHFPEVNFDHVRLSEIISLDGRSAGCFAHVQSITGCRIFPHLGRSPPSSCHCRCWLTNFAGKHLELPDCRWTKLRGGL